MRDFLRKADAEPSESRTVNVIEVTAQFFASIQFSVLSFSQGKDYISDRLSRKLSNWKHNLFEIVLFAVFVAMLLNFFAYEMWHIIRPLVR
jgi:hypothetical protein